MLADLLVLLGFALVVGGIAMFSVPIAVAVTGIFLVLVAFGLGRRREAN